eukprot:SAG31_NODE_703_length_12720_cov_10.185088_12_plen_75_part_00
MLTAAKECSFHLARAGRIHTQADLLGARQTRGACRQTVLDKMDLWKIASSRFRTACQGSPVSRPYHTILLRVVQ